VRKVDLLHQIQDVDSRLDAARTAVAQLQAEIGERSAIARREAELAVVQRQLHGLQGQQRDLDLQADEKRAKIKVDEAKLYGGRVTSPKELQSLTDEVAQDRRQLSSIEDQLLELYDRLDELTKQASALEATLARETAAWKARQQELTSRLAENESALVALQTRRESSVATLDPAARSTYESLRRQKGGVAVATVHQRTCQACRVGLTASQEQRARIGNELATCNSCGRILFVALT